MNWLTTFHFIRPWWLIALIPAIVIAVLLFRRYQAATAWSETIDAELGLVERHFATKAQAEAAP